MNKKIVITVVTAAVTTFTINTAVAEADETPSTAAARIADTVDTTDQAKEPITANKQTDTGSQIKVTDTATKEVQPQEAVTASINTNGAQQAKIIALATASSKSSVEQQQQTAVLTQKYTADQNRADQELTAQTIKAKDTYASQTALQQQNNTEKQKEAQAKVEQAQTEAQKTAAEKITAATPNAQTNAPTEAYEPGHAINSETDLPTKLVEPQITDATTPTYYDYYGYRGGADTSAQIDGSLDKAQQYELADYTLTLLNDWRAARGLTKIHYNQNVEEATLALVALRNKENKDFDHITFNEQETSIFDQRGLNLVGENLGVSMPQKTTLLQLKVETLNAITAMIWQDEAHYNGHLQNFATAEYMGFGVQANPKMAYPYQLVFEMAELSNSDVQAPDIELTAEKKIDDKRVAARAQLVRTDPGLMAANRALAKLEIENQQQLLSLQQQQATALAQLKANHTAELGKLTVAYQAELAALQLKKQPQLTTLAKKATPAKQSKRKITNQTETSSKTVRTSRLELVQRVKFPSLTSAKNTTHQLVVGPKKVGNTVETSKEDQINQTKRNKQHLPQLGNTAKTEVSVLGMIISILTGICGVKAIIAKHRKGRSLK
ncbi:SEC10/PgrA surface exclusion domain-containing protein [Liquorilactobacillus capillatus]|uniref:Cell surface protein n=1 Tax=Liquorilactobacillus capillatus DSM 19910 TaxID=1423731 RepID=A0A0R1MBU0_9LACO|nr:SEC10/PgrA surface exclusion domain-containing protein [Liquorilactobacillus capillatus]KRL00840.1 cell surface protein [Liquorilactobacillus capillatus DSM 19910]